MPDNVYDAVRYSNNPYAQTHPERLATVAILHGLIPPDPFHARVLEKTYTSQQAKGSRDAAGGRGLNPAPNRMVKPKNVPQK